MSTDPTVSLALELAPDRFLVCQNCGLTFVWTGWEQRRGDGEPQYCPGCRHLLELTRRQRGTVKWYDGRKHFGFITAADGSEVFVHRRALGRLRALRRGDVVAFRIEQTELGPQAVSVERLSGRKRRKSKRRRTEAGAQS